MVNPVPRGSGKLPIDEIDQIGSLDRQFREAVPDFEARLHKIVEEYYPFSDR